MGKLFDGIDDKLAEWIGAQSLFFVATAPPDGHLNLSPKGLDGTFRVLTPTQVAWLDLTGSGVETIAHLRADGRVVVMLCAFSGPPRIVRLHGHGRVVLPADRSFASLVDAFPPLPGVRSVIVVDLDRISDSCGFGVPRMTLVGDRDDLPRWAERKGSVGIADYQRTRNAESIDGLPGLDPERVASPTS